MARPKGSKNKPKAIQSQPVLKAVPKVEEPPKKKGRPKKYVEKPVETIVSTVSTPNTGPTYVPFDMTNFIFTEHWLMKMASRIHSEIPQEASMSIIQEAARHNEDSKIFTVRKMLRGLGLSVAQTESLIQGIKEYKHNKSTVPQLYYKFKKS